MEPESRPERRGSYWLLLGGLGAAFLASFLLSDTPRIQMTSRSLVIVGTITHVLAWFLPAIVIDNGDVFGSTTVRGWEAFRFALLSAFEFPEDLKVSRISSNILATASALSNLALAGTFVDVLLNAGHPHPAIRAALFVCAVLNTQWLFRAWLSREFDLRVGYYLWAGSFFVIAIGLP